MELLHAAMKQHLAADGGNDQLPASKQAHVGHQRSQSVWVGRRWRAHMHACMHASLQAGRLLPLPLWRQQGGLAGGD